MISAKCDVIVDLQFGSTGKGLIAGYLAIKNEYDTVVNANMPNAGHTFIDHHNRKWVHKVLPNGIVSPKLKNIMIGPGSVFSIERLIEEVDASRDLLGGVTIFIHNDAVVLQPQHIEAEVSSLSGISSTMQGSSAAMIEKIQRNANDNCLAKQILRDMSNISGVPVAVINNKQWLDMLYLAESILLEGAQGYSLGINSGFWPYCTSRDCTALRFMSDCSIPTKFLRRIIGTARTYPIRVGNTTDGYSGPAYRDQKEIEWDDIGVIPELTTVTGRKRRLFTFSEEQIKEAIMAIQPDEIFLNFANYCPQEVDKLITAIDGFLQMYVPGGGMVRYVGFGPTSQDVHERSLLNPCDYTREEHVQGYV